MSLIMIMVRDVPCNHIATCPVVLILRKIRLGLGFQLFTLRNGWTKYEMILVLTDTQVI